MTALIQNAIARSAANDVEETRCTVERISRALRVVAELCQVSGDFEHIDYADGHCEVWGVTSNQEEFLLVLMEGDR